MLMRFFSAVTHDARFDVIGRHLCTRLFKRGASRGELRKNVAAVLAVLEQAAQSADLALK